MGHAAPSTDASYLAAVYACGSGAAILGGVAASWRYGLTKGPAPRPEVIRPTRGDQFRRYTWGDVFEHPAR